MGWQLGDFFISYSLFLNFLLLKNLGHVITVNIVAPVRILYHFISNLFF